MQGYSDSALETVAARSAGHASVTAQNGEAMPVKVGLMRVVQLKEWKKGSLHEQMLELKGLGRTLSQEYKKVDVVRPYAKAGPLVAASVHPGTYHIILAPSVK